MSVIRRDGPDLILEVRLTPRGGTDAIDGIKALGDGRLVLAARVRAVPEDGKANRALEELVARHLRLAKSAVSVAGGAQSRQKSLRLSDIDAAGETRIRDLLEP